MRIFTSKQKIAGFVRGIALSFAFVCAFFALGSHNAQASTLPVGDISTCGTLAAAGTYSVTQNISGVAGTCFIITSNGVTITSSSTAPSTPFTITAAGGNVSYAITATSSVAGGSAYGTTTIQNLTFTSFNSGGINANGNATTSNTAGSGGNIFISSSTLGIITATGGIGSGSGAGGAGGSLTINNSTVTTIATSGGGGGGSFGFSALGGAGGSLTINNSTTTTITTVGGNGGNGAVAGGNGGIGGSVTIASSSVSSIVASGGTGGGNGGIGAAGGSVTIATSTTSSIVASGSSGSNNTGGAGGTITINNSTTTTITTSGGAGSSGAGSGAGGNGGSVTIATSTVGSITASGGAAGSSGAAGVGGTLTINNSTATTLTTSGGAGGAGGAGAGGNGASGGVILIQASSTIATTTSQGGAGGSKSSAGTAGNGGSAGTITVANSTSTGLISALPGAAGVGTGGATNGSIGTGATTTIATSTTSSVTSTGTNGSIVITGSNLNLSNNTYTANSTLSLAYSGTLTTTNATTSALTHLIINSVDEGSYIGGPFPLIPGVINSCGTLYFIGTYTLGGNVTGSCNLSNTGITIAGAGHTLTGNVTANSYGVTLSNITVTGAVSTTGATPGALTVNNASNLTGTVSVTGVLNGDGSSSVGSTTINAGALVATSSVNFSGNVINNGTIGSGNPVAGNTTNNGTINTGAGSFTFNATSTNPGTVNGNAILNASSTNIGTITGTARFNMYTASSNVVTFSGATTMPGTGYVTGNIYDSTGAVITSWIFNNTSANTGYTKGDATFNNSSSNNSGATIVGNAVFNNASTNLGTVTGNATVNSPVVRPLGGIVNGTVTYYGYAGLYFNDGVAGHGVTGKWNDLNNWWTNAVFTIHAPVLPTAGDDVIVASGTISSISSGSASVMTATFQGTANNGISLTVLSTSTSAALFTASSSNSGTIVGNAMFMNADTNNSGTITGHVTRQYNAGVYVATADFTANSLHWIVQSVNGAQVNLANATYSLVTDAFQALNNGIFTAWNSLFGGGSSGAPVLVVSSPASGTNIKWAPVVAWGTSNLCQYKIDGGAYVTVLCANNGSDIPRPTAAAHTMFFKSTDAKSDPASDITEKSVDFIYDNTQPVDTNCSAPLDEATRSYYYLTGNVAGSCTITASTTLRGDDGAGHFYTVGGNIIGSSTNDVALQNLTVAGSVSGFNHISVSSSTLSSTIDVTGSLVGDALTTFGSTTIESGATVTGGRFVANMLNKSGGTITTSSSSPVTVAGNTTNNGTINGNFTFNGYSTNAGTINGDLTYSTLTSNAGVVTFASTTAFQGTGVVSGVIRDQNGNAITRWKFNDSSANAGYTKGDSFFYGNSFNAGTVAGNAYFSNSSANVGGAQVTGNADVYYSVTTPLTGTVGGSITYHSYPNAESFSNSAGDNAWSNLLNWYTDTTLAIPLGRTPTPSEIVVLFASTTLPADVTNDVYIAVGSTTIDGASHTLAGNIFGNGAYGGHSAYSFNLANITVTGTTTANGSVGATGGNGGTISIDTSTTGSIIANGANGTANGGKGGSVLINNSFSIPSDSIIETNGGDSTSCGNGGDAGDVTLTNSTYGTVTANSGNGSNIGCPLESHLKGNNSIVVITGHYTPPAIGGGNSSGGASQGPSVGGSSISPEALATLLSPGTLGLGLLHTVSIPVNLPSKLKLTPLPLFGDETGSFNFRSPIGSFLFSPVAKKYKLMDYMASVGIIHEQSFASLHDRPISLNSATSTKKDGMYTVMSGTTTLPVVISSDADNYAFQLIKANQGSVIHISMKPIVKGKVSGVFNNVSFSFSAIKGGAYVADITVPKTSGRYFLSSSFAASPLAIDVVEFHPVVTTVSAEPLTSKPPTASWWLKLITFGLAK